MRVAEKFVSINGEGTRAGEPAVFIRFAGCNLSCSYCDTKWANEPECPYEELSAEEILSYVKGCEILNVTLTGGEPLLADGIGELMDRLAEAGFRVEIETNGAVDLSGVRDCGNGACGRENPPVFTMDYKLPSSGCEGRMLTDNFSLLRKDDTVKFVAGTREDLRRAAELIREYELTKKCHVYFSPVFGAIEPAEIVDFMIENKMNGVRLQIQMHKVIWDPDKRGV